MSLGDQLHQVLSELQWVAQETTLMIGAIVLLVGGLILKKSVAHKAMYLISLLVGLYFTNSHVGLILSDSMELTAVTSGFSGLISLSLIMVTIFPANHKHSVEFYFLLLALGVGSLFMMKANSLLTIYLAVELVSFVAYILTNFSFRKSAHEAAIKYLLFGALSSAIMLFGLALLYGTTGTFYLSEWNFNTFSSLLPQISMVLVLLGLFFKISIFPMHIWVPATYQTAPVDAVTIFSIVPKLAGLVLLQRVLINASLSTSHWLYSLILLLGIATILIGTFGALSQKNTRRMISFGAIAHSGFLLPFALIIGDTSEQAFWWYAVVYIIMNFGAFYLVHQYEKRGVYENEAYSEAKSDVWMGAVFTLILISLVGLPPFAGFTAKFFLFSMLWEIYWLTNETIFMIYLIVAVLATVASLFFYLRIPYHLFLSKQERSTSIEFSRSTKIIATIFGIALLLLFFVPKLVVMIHHLLSNIHE